MAASNPALKQATSGVTHKIHNEQVGTEDGLPVIDQYVRSTTIEAALAGLQAALAPAAVVSLNAATATAAGSALTLTGARAGASLQVVLTGGPSAVVVALEASLNGTNWASTGIVWSLAAQTSGDMVAVTNLPALYWRAHLTTLTGGTSPTVTAIVAVC